MALLDKVEESNWFPVVSDGHMKCSCGRPLEKLEDGRYRCSYGFPTFDMKDDEIRIDKFGNVWLKKKDHDDNKMDKGGK